MPILLTCMEAPLSPGVVGEGAGPGVPNGDGTGDVVEAGTVGGGDVGETGISGDIEGAIGEDGELIVGGEAIGGGIVVVGGMLGGIMVGDGVVEVDGGIVMLIGGAPIGA
ncbi:hypothetical protein LIER_03484 [Lithospermum erythrorhizon]|uniref:Uncharacterized protein n=1 Tax=Lithospermum erythrorhizon TaxID=34254 RepID=A0AAV3NUM7_LITER